MSARAWKRRRAHGRRLRLMKLGETFRRQAARRWVNVRAYEPLTEESIARIASTEMAVRLFWTPPDEDPAIALLVQRGYFDLRGPDMIDE